MSPQSRFAFAPELIVDLFAGAGGASEGIRQARKLRAHGLSYSPEYRAWQTMVHRCTNPKNQAWQNYGGRGIAVCESWLDDPTQFYRDMGKKPSPAHELDRIDNNAGYSPENCRWVSRSVNDRNRRSNRHLTHDGLSLTVAEWAERTGIGSDTIAKRLDAGWSIADALTTPTRAKATKGQSKRLQRQPCADCGVPVTGARCHACENRARVKVKEQQVRACGNSVCPPIARALVSANVGELLAMEQLERAA